MPVKILNGDIHLIDLQTRLPFKYGIATMTQAPYAFVRIFAEVNGQESFGVAADVLPPKWFTKVPDKSLDEEVDEMLEVIEHAVDCSAGIAGESAFDIWRQLYESQSQWGIERGFPPLLFNFGTSLVERALIETTCKALGKTLSEATRTNALGIELDMFDERLSALQPDDLLPTEPLRRVIARHTVGMADPLEDSDITAADRLNDGLPQSLAACIQTYNLKHFKLKVSGNVDQDVDRLSRTAAIIQQFATSDFAFTMDGNEFFHSLDDFRHFWQNLRQSDRLARFFEQLIYVEQPFHRDVALDTDVLQELSQWQDRPKLIIDESDAELNSLSRALELGYHGTSHKNCKGVFKSIGSACLLEKLRRDAPEVGYIMSGEDLANVGPVALIQDLAAVATLGVTSVERNGHHFFAGLSAFPDTVQQQVLANHGDLYQKSSSGWPTLDIRDGELKIDSIVDAPFGVGFEIDVKQFTPSEVWRKWN